MTTIKHGETGSQYLKNFHVHFQEVQQYGYIPLWDIQRQSTISSETPLFHYLLVFENYPIEGFQDGAHTLNQLGFEIAHVTAHERTNYPLTIVCSEQGQQLQLKLDYAEGHFEQKALEQFCQHWRQLLHQLIDHPEKSHTAYGLLGAEETQQIVVEWNDTKQEYPKDQTLLQLYEAQLQKTPNHIAVIFEEQQWTYLELNEKANQLAHYLIQHGVKVESKVAIMMERSIELIIGILGILKAGGVYVPLDPSYPEERLRYMLEDSEAEILLTMSSLDFLNDFCSCQNGFSIICYDELEHLLNSNSIQNPEISLFSQNLAYIIYTSGSTGKPKGVLISQQAVNRLVFNDKVVSCFQEDRIAHASNCAFDAATFEIWNSLLKGCALVIVSKEILFNAQNLKNYFREHQVSIAWLTAGLFNQLFDEIPTIFESMRTLLIGGEALDVSRVLKFCQQNRATQLINGYGPTETTTFATCYPLNRDSREYRSIPIGKTINNTICYILDAHLNPVLLGFLASCTLVVRA